MKDVGQQLISGGLSGFTSTICLQPLDLLKTRLQQGDGSRVSKEVPSIYQLSRRIVASDGTVGLWRGTTATLLRNIPGVAMYKTMLTQVRTIMAVSPSFVFLQRAPVQTNFSTSSRITGSVLPKLSPAGDFLSGGTTRIIVGIILNPLSVLKARFESNLGYNSTEYRTILGGLRSMSKGGPSELFKGVVPSAIRDAPYAGLFITFYEVIKRETASTFGSSSFVTSSGVHTFSAASAGAIATVVTHPFDVIKTKVQVRSEDRYQGLSKTVATIWKQRGALGFFDGVSLRFSRKVLSSAIGWTVYEGMLMFLH